MEHREQDNELDPSKPGDGFRFLMQIPELYKIPDDCHPDDPNYRNCTFGLAGPADWCCDLESWKAGFLGGIPCKKCFRRKRKVMKSFLFRSEEGKDDAGGGCWNRL